MNFLTLAGSSVISDTLITTPGNTLTLYVFTTQAQPISSVAGLLNGVDDGNTYVQKARYDMGAGLYYLYVFVAQNINGGPAHRFEAFCSGGSSLLGIGITESSGRDPTGAPLDGTPVTYVDTGFVQPHPDTLPFQITTVNDGSDLICVVTNNGNVNNTTFTAGSGWTRIIEKDGSTGTYVPMMVMYRPNVVHGTYSAPWTTSNFVKGGAILFALNKLPPGGGGSGTGSLAGGGKTTSSATGRILQLGQVLLTGPLYSGVGGVLDPNFWFDSKPGVGTLLYYDPTFITITPTGEIISTSNDCASAVQFYDGTAWATGLIVLTPQMVAYPRAQSSASGILAGSVGVSLAGNAQSQSSLDGQLTTQNPSANTLPSQRPRVRRVNVRALVYELDGSPRAYPIYDYGRRQFFKRPFENPAAGLVAEEDSTGGGPGL